MNKPFGGVIDRNTCPYVVFLIFKRHIIAGKQGSRVNSPQHEAKTVSKRTELRHGDGEAQTRRQVAALVRASFSVLSL